MPKNEGIVGVSDHGGWAVLVTISLDGALLDWRRVELVDDDLPAIPHHHEAQMLPVDDAVALVERVRVCAERHAVLALEGVAACVPGVRGIALRACPQLPPTIAERLKDYRARTVADWVMYRTALADAAASRGWPIFWYDAKKVLDSGYAIDLRRTAGPPWNHDHKLAMAAALTMVDRLLGSA